MCVRAKHLEVRNNFTTNVFVLVYTRFLQDGDFWVNPKILITDNTKTFLLASKVNHKKIANSCSTNDKTILNNFNTRYEVYWRFNTKCAPWKSGFMIGLVKYHLKRCISIPHRPVDFLNLHTIF